MFRTYYFLGTVLSTLCMLFFHMILPSVAIFGGDLGRKFYSFNLKKFPSTQIFFLEIREDSYLNLYFAYGGLIYKYKMHTDHGHSLKTGLGEKALSQGSLLNSPRASICNQFPKHLLTLDMQHLFASLTQLLLFWALLSSHPL